MGESLISWPPQGGLVKRPHGYEGFTGERAKARFKLLHRVREAHNGAADGSLR